MSHANVQDEMSYITAPFDNTSSYSVTRYKLLQVEKIPFNITIKTDPLKEFVENSKCSNVEDRVYLRSIWSLDEQFKRELATNAYECNSSKTVR